MFRTANPYILKKAFSVKKDEIGLYRSYDEYYVVRCAGEYSLDLEMLDKYDACNKIFNIYFPNANPNALLGPTVKVIVWRGKLCGKMSEVV